MFCGGGALEFAKDHGVKEVSLEYLATEKAGQRLAKFAQFEPSLKVEFYEHADG